MRLVLTVAAPAVRRTADVVLEADPATPVADIAAELGRFISGDAMEHHAPPGGGGRQGARVLRFPGAHSQGSLAMASPIPDAEPFSIPLYVDHHRIPPELSLAESWIRDGAIVSLGSPEGCMFPERAGLVEIRVMSGPMVGSIHRLGPGHCDIGSGQAASFRLRDPSIPSVALRIFADGRGGCQVAPYEGVQATLDREPLTVPAQWHPGQIIAVGSSLLGLAPYEPPDAALHTSLDGSGIDFNRPPRLLPPERITRFQLPARPSEAERRPLPILMAALPLLMGVGMAFLLHQVYLLAMAGLSPLMLVGGYLSERSHGRKARARELAAYREHKARIERDADAALEAEWAGRRDRFPDRPRCCRSPPGRAAGCGSGAAPTPITWCSGSVRPTCRRVSS